MDIWLRSFSFWKDTPVFYWKFTYHDTFSSLNWGNLSSFYMQEKAITKYVAHLARNLCVI